MNTDSKTTAENPFLHFKARCLILCSFLISGAIGFVLSLTSRFSGFNPKDPIFGPIIYMLTFIGLCFWAIQQLRRLQLNIKRLIGQLPSNYPWLPTIGIVIAILLFSLGSGQLFYYILSLYNPTRVESLLNQKVFLYGAETFAPSLYNSLTIITFVVVAPVAEEFIFRGILLHRLTTKWGAMPAILISALLFAMLHANIIGLFVFGLMMTLLYIKTRTLIVPIICHSLNNFAAIGLEFLSTTTGTHETISNLEQLRSYWWIGIVYMLLSAPILINFIYKNWPKQPSCLPYFTNTAK